MTIQIHNQTFMEAMQVYARHDREQLRVSRSDKETIRAATVFERMQMSWDRLRGRATDDPGRSAAVRALLIEKLTAELSASALLEAESVGGNRPALNPVPTDAFRASAGEFLFQLESSAEPLTETKLVQKLHTFALSITSKPSMNHPTSVGDSTLAAQSFERLHQLNGQMIRAGKGRKFVKLSVNELLKPIQQAPAATVRFGQVSHVNDPEAVAKNALWVQKKFGLDDRRAFWYGAEMTRPELAALGRDAGFHAVCFAIEEQRKAYTSLALKPSQPISAEQNSRLKKTFEDSLNAYADQKNRSIREDTVHQAIRQWHPNTVNKKAVAALMVDPLFSELPKFRALRLEDQIAVVEKFGQQRQAREKNRDDYPIEQMKKDVETLNIRQRDSSSSQEPLPQSSSIPWGKPVKPGEWI